MVRLPGLACSLLLLVHGAGCGQSRPETYPVRGIVRIENGTPLQTGVIELYSEAAQQTAHGKIQPDGTFVLGTFTDSDGACAGHHKAIVLQFVVNDGVTVHSRDHGPAVDPIYASYDTSGLTVEVQPNENNSIEIVVQPRKRN